MKNNSLLLFLFPLSLLLCQPVFAAGLKLYPSSVRLIQEDGKTAETAFEITNTADGFEIVRAYSDHASMARVIPSDFVLAPGETKAVRAVVYPGCQAACQLIIKVEAWQPEGVGAGAVAELKVEGKKKVSGANEALASFLALIVVLWISRVDRKKKAV